MEVVSLLRSLGLNITAVAINIPLLRSLRAFAAADLNDENSPANLGTETLKRHSRSHSEKQY